MLFGELQLLQLLYNIQKICLCVTLSEKQSFGCVYKLSRTQL